jgi:transcriptional regulator with XRE-family HTH domain
LKRRGIWSGGCKNLDRDTVLGGDSETSDAEPAPRGNALARERPLVNGLPVLTDRVGQGAVASQDQDDFTAVVHVSDVSPLRRYGKRQISDIDTRQNRLNGDMVLKPTKKPAMAKPRGKGPKSSELKAMVCARLKAAGEAYQTNQRALAKLLEIDPRQLNGYYRGKHYPDEMILVKFCNLTGCTMDWIFRGLLDVKMPPETAIWIAINEPGLMAPAARAAAGLPSGPDPSLARPGDPQASQEPEPLTRKTRTNPKTTRP